MSRIRLCGSGCCPVLEVMAHPPSVSFRILRIQKEKEEAERRQVEAAIQCQREQEELVKEKEREILQLQV